MRPSLIPRHKPSSCVPIFVSFVHLIPTIERHFFKIVCPARQRSSYRTLSLITPSFILIFGNQIYIVLLQLSYNFCNIFYFSNTTPPVISLLFALQHIFIKPRLLKFICVLFFNDFPNATKPIFFFLLITSTL